MSHDSFGSETPNVRKVLAAKVKRTQSTRAFLRDYVVMVDNDCVVTYTGEQLDINDWRVFDELIRLADGRLDVPCQVTCQELCLGLRFTSFETLKKILIRLSAVLHFSSQDGNREDVITLINGFDCVNYEILTYTISSKTVHALAIKN